MLELNKQKGLINIKLTFTFHMCMEHGMVLPEEMDDFKTNFDSTYTVILPPCNYYFSHNKNNNCLEGWHNQIKWNPCI